MSVDGSDLELVLDGSLQTVGLRFRNLAIPKGAVIASAFVQLQADEAQTAATALTIQAHAIDNAPTFLGNARNISNRARADHGTLVAGGVKHDRRRGRRPAHARVPTVDAGPARVVTSLAIQGEASDNAAIYTGTSRSISTRARTVESVAWTPAPWNVPGAVRRSGPPVAHAAR